MMAFPQQGQFLYFLQFIEELNLIFCERFLLWKKLVFPFLFAICIIYNMQSKHSMNFKKIPTGHPFLALKSKNFLNCNNLTTS